MFSKKEKKNPVLLFTSFKQEDLGEIGKKNFVRTYYQVKRLIIKKNYKTEFRGFTKE